ncbi:helix-turn-helix domain-containing protein [Falsiroseomonas sp. CW058]|uniref:helix-turn-helix domain-containing protein n=1 Tax=Falsiroseomonas sp. CW058 TaxID=3388664 RepID=UPI003D320D75
MDTTPEIVARIEGRLDRLGLTAEEADRLAGLSPGTLAALLHGEAGLPRGAALRRLAAALDAGEEFLLGLEPGDLVPAEMLEDPQGELGLLAPDEEALLRNYRRLDIPGRAAVNLLVARAAGPGPEPVEEKAPARRRQPRRSQPGIDLAGG